jgi:hypothetical protein
MGLAHDDILFRPALIRVQRSAFARAVLVYCAAFTIALLNPLLCMLHCAITVPPPALTSEQRHFLCGIGSATQTVFSAPVGAIWHGPQVIQPALPVAAIALPALLPVVLMALPTSVIRPQNRLQPELPPPRY